MPVYIVHALDEVRAARDRGAMAFAETCPQYLFLSLDDLGTTITSTCLRCGCSVRDIQLVVPRGIASILRDDGFERVIELATGTAVDVGGLNIAAVKAVHSGFRVPFGPAGEAVGYLIDEGSERVPLTAAYDGGPCLTRTPC